ncbi:osmoprotectant transport system ATP-binding protein [Pullulanibacillus pueri]|uniref:Quaternary amine transport ATP-binding protein n=1 Tax=Pullulanibacillus pueri TaxID=1437324 RepID=A0A8J2ZX96_9BACL|nr:betaine/proline/choline family ABC transporter ATP-binding protein [Pullulanibacillus pueri]MBM7681912.1 osmoprotectant transport system ATP-binding protein [Pullulanibacillus pueri]GGH83416.1 glycine/betaine ABC transporter ATPase [Pullulanibacillus pueri]
MIEFQEISKVYEDGFKALKDISFTVKEGELLVLIGPSGCGKTTTMKMINRLIEPSKGTIMIEGKDIANENPVNLRRNIGYVIQQIGLLPHMTIRENVSLVPRLKKWEKDRYLDKVNELMEMVGLDPETFGERYPSELSGGQQQRIGVIRGLAADPKIILMDEPFSALDPISREQLQEELVKLQKEIHKTIVFVTHDMDEALKIADRICIMKDGEIVQLDTPENILRHPANDFVHNFIGEERIQDNIESEGVNLPSLKKLMVKPITAYSTRGLAEALKTMRKRRVDNLIVVDKDDTYLGIATVWDAQKNYQNENLTLNDIKQTDLKVLTPDVPAEEAFQRVNTSQYGFIPVIEHDSRKLLGIVNRASLVEHIVDQIIQ